MRQLRPSQLETYHELRGESRIILNSPTGWGKTTVLSFLAADRLRGDPVARVVVIVPQKIISRGWVAPQTLQSPDGHLTEWAPIDLCGATKSKVDRLVEFLVEPVGEKRVVVTTHAGFTAAYARLGKRFDGEGLVLIVDESHHLQAAEVEARNQLGHAVSHLLGRGVSLWLATAFFFRGDKTAILPASVLEEFKRVFIPLDEHLSSMRYTKEYLYDFVAYRSSVFPELASLLKSSHEPTLIYCPPAGHSALGGLSKEAFVGRVLDLLLKNYRGSTLWSPSVPVNAGRVILDLASQDDREAKSRYLYSHAANIAAVVAVGMLKEGCDWPPCQRVIDLVPSASDQERNQKFGRLIRDYPRKSTVRYYSFLPLLLDKGDEQHRVLYSRLFAHFHASLILDNALHPIRMPVAKGSRDDKTPVKRVNLLGEFTEPQQQEIESAVSDALVSLAAESEASGQPLSWQEASTAILSALRDLECAAVVGEGNMEPLRDQIILLWRRRKNPQIDLIELIGQGFDKVWSPDALAPIKLFSAGHCGCETFQELREILAVSGRVAAEEWARTAAARYKPGELPSLVAMTPEARSDAQKITALRMAKSGKGRVAWYPSVEEIFSQSGHVDAFEQTDHQAIAERWARDCAARYEPGRLPTWRDKDPQRARDGKRLDRYRSAKRGTGGRAGWYPTLEDIFAGAGHMGAFDSAPDRSIEVEEWARDCAARYQPGKLPSARSPLGEVAKRDGSKIQNLRAAKRGTSKGTWYPDVEEIFAHAGHVGAFC